MKDEFLATLAHELRSPMAPLRNGLQLLRFTTDPKIREQARAMMERQLGQMVRLVDDLLDISRISRNKLELRKARIDLWVVIQSAVETARPHIEASGHTLTVALPPSPVYLDADLTRLSQVFSNLLTNSAKYTNPGGYISLTATLQGTDAVVVVQDTGIGIPAEALPRLFEIFSQVDRNMERAQGGLGIGLSLVKGLTESHGGTVEVRSDGIGKGSSFVVRLPVTQGVPVHEKKARQDSTSCIPKRRILVVDDNRDGASSLALLLTLMGHDTRTAHDGLEGIELAEAFRPDLIVLDIGLPKLNGLDACRLTAIINAFEANKRLADRAVEQVPDEKLHLALERSLGYTCCHLGQIVQVARVHAGERMPASALRLSSRVPGNQMQIAAAYC